jgi:hypothetical protein
VIGGETLLSENSIFLVGTVLQRPYVTLRTDFLKQRLLITKSNFGNGQVTRHVIGRYLGKVRSTRRERTTEGQVARLLPVGCRKPPRRGETRWGKATSSLS